MQRRNYTRNSLFRQPDCSGSIDLSRDAVKQMTNLRLVGDLVNAKVGFVIANPLWGTGDNTTTNAPLCQIWNCS